MRIIRREIEKKYKNSDLIKKLSQEKQYFIRRYLDLSKVKALLIGVCKYTSNRCCDLPHIILQKKNQHDDEGKINIISCLYRY